MRRAKVEIPSDKHKHHTFSAALENDHRVDFAPRHISVVHKKEGAVFAVKIYATLETPGSELMTVSCVTEKTGTEFEFRFDERYPVSLRFKGQTDEERVAYAIEQITRGGGFAYLEEQFGSLFPKFRV